MSVKSGQDVHACRGITGPEASSGQGGVTRHEKRGPALDAPTLT